MICDTDKVYVGDTGTAVILDTEEDLSTAISYSILARTPLGAELEWAADIYEVTKLKYVDTLGVIGAIAGEWRFKTKVSFPYGTWSGDTVRKTVHTKWR